MEFLFSNTLQRSQGWQSSRINPLTFLKRSLFPNLPIRQAGLHKFP